METKQYAVFGLGIFGSTVAKTLSKYGCEVLAVDRNMTCVERIAEHVTKAVVANVTDKDELLRLGIREFDVVIIAIGSHLEESILATMLVKELGVPFVIAKAKNRQFKQILEKIGADLVVRPEKEMGIRIAKRLLRKSIVDLVEIDEDYSIVEIRVPDAWVGKSLELLNLRKTYSINVLGYKTRTNKHLQMDIDPKYVVEKGTHFLVVAKTDEIERFDYMMKES